MAPLLRLGKYVIEGLLGPGGVTETYLAHPSAGAEPAVLALKLLRLDRIADGLHEEARRRFLAAAMQLRDFHRPGFAKVVEVCDEPAATFMVSELVVGHDVLRLVEHHRAAGGGGRVLVDPALAGLIGCQVARLLQVAHVAKPMLCHLGLSPQNVVVGADGDVTLLDAGIAASLRGITEQPAERWAFVAPELQGVDIASVVLDERRRTAGDLFALGGILYFMVSGELPPLGGHPLRLDLDALVGPLAGPLRSLLSPEPHERPECAQRVVEWLAGGDGRDRRERIADGLRAASAIAEPSPVRAEDSVLQLPGPGTVSPKRSRRRFVAGALLLSTAVGVGLLALAQAPSRPVPGRVLPTRTPTSALPALPFAPQAPTTPGSLSDTVLAGMAGHLIVETVPPGARVFVDGVLKGETFADIRVGEGRHRIAVVAAGHRMVRDEVDTTAGVVIRRTLVPIPPPGDANGLLTVDCRGTTKLAIVLDGEETGLLCPAKLIPASQGKHVVGVFVPAQHRVVFLETTVAAGSKPTLVRFVQ